MTTNLLLAPKLQPGDLVRLVSPASYPDQPHIDNYIETLESWGLRCDVGDSVLGKHGYMAGTDAERLDDLNKAFRDPEVRAVIATRGGAGAYRIADDIDFEAVRSDPKLLVGFSDITFLHLSLLTHGHVGGIHGCLNGDITQSSTRQLLMTTNPITLVRNSAAISAAVNIEGHATGPIVGGNLQSVSTSVGVRMPSMVGAILFLEYHRKGLGTVDRYLTQLMRSGALDGIAGVALGSFECGRDFSDRGWTIADVLHDRLGSLNVPVLGGLNSGHDLLDQHGNSNFSAIPLGSVATLDTNEGTITIEPVVK